MDVAHSVPWSCLCCSPSSSALIPALLSSSNTTVLSACLTMPWGAITAARPSTLSCWSLGWSSDRPWPPGPSAAPTPGPAPAPTTTSGASSCFWVMAGFFKAVDNQIGNVRHTVVNVCFFDLPQGQIYSRFLQPWPQNKRFFFFWLTRLVT